MLTDRCLENLDLLIGLSNNAEKRERWCREKREKKAALRQQVLTDSILASIN